MEKDELYDTDMLMKLLIPNSTREEAALAELLGEEYEDDDMMYDEDDWIDEEYNDDNDFNAIRRLMAQSLCKDERYYMDSKCLYKLDKEMYESSKNSAISMRDNWGDVVMECLKTAMANMYGGSVEK